MPAEPKVTVDRPPVHRGHLVEGALPHRMIVAVQPLQDRVESGRERSMGGVYAGGGHVRKVMEKGRNDNGTTPRPKADAAGNHGAGPPMTMSSLRPGEPIVFVTILAMAFA